MPACNPFHSYVSKSNKYIVFPRTSIGGIVLLGTFGGGIDTGEKILTKLGKPGRKGQN